MPPHSPSGLAAGLYRSVVLVPSWLLSDGGSRVLPPCTDGARLPPSDFQGDRSKPGPGRGLRMVSGPWLESRCLVSAQVPGGLRPQARRWWWGDRTGSNFPLRQQERGMGRAHPGGL